MDQLLEIIYQASEFFGSGFYQWMTELFAQLVEWYTIAKLNFLAFMVKFSWDIAANILINVGISDVINNAWSSLDSQVLNAITFFRIPEGVNIIFQAGITKFVLRVLGI